MQNSVAKKYEHTLTGIFIKIGQEFIGWSGYTKNFADAIVFSTEKEAASFINNYLKYEDKEKVCLETVFLKAETLQTKKYKLSV